MAAGLSSILVVLAAVALRLQYFRGLGLGDDLRLSSDIGEIVRYGHVHFGPNGYRFTWWIPTALSCRLLGVTEAGLITPIVVSDVLGIVLVSLFARRLWMVRSTCGWTRKAVWKSGPRAAGGSCRWDWP